MHHPMNLITAVFLSPKIPSNEYYKTHNWNLYCSVKKILTMALRVLFLKIKHRFLLGSLRSCGLIFSITKKLSEMRYILVHQDKYTIIYNILMKRSRFLMKQLQFFSRVYTMFSRSHVFLIT